MKLLVADDEGLPRRLLARALEQRGYEVTTAGDGAEAWEQFQSIQHPIIVSDWNMPAIDGVELCRRVRGLRDASYTYFILLTSRSDKESLVYAMAAGADDFVAKPFDADELHARIRSGERILTLAHELARRMTHLTEANRCIRQINSQMSHDVQQLAGALNAWVERPAMGKVDDAMGHDPQGYKQILRGEVMEIVKNWVTSLAPDAPEAGQRVPGAKSA